MSDRVQMSVEGRVAEVRLTRPEKRNALDPAMLGALIETAAALAADPAVRAVVLRGEGEDFCAGADRAAFGDLARGERPAAAAHLMPTEGPARAVGQRMIHAWHELAVPVIAALHGHVLGGGLQFALAADVRIVTPDARLALPEIGWGLVPDMTGTQFLPDLVRRDVAKELALTGRMVRGDDAVGLGLATRVADDPVAAAHELAATIAARNPDAVRWIVHLLDRGGRGDHATAFAAEQEAMAALIGTPNVAEAVAARVEGRAPVFADPEPPPE